MRSNYRKGLREAITGKRIAKKRIAKKRIAGKGLRKKVAGIGVQEKEYKKREGTEMKRFKELYLAGEIEFEAIDDFSYDWGMNEEECTLAQYLGLNAEEEDAWVSVGEDALRELLEKQKK